MYAVKLAKALLRSRVSKKCSGEGAEEYATKLYASLLNHEIRRVDTNETFRLSVRDVCNLIAPLCGMTYGDAFTFFYPAGADEYASQFIDNEVCEDLRSRGFEIV